MKNTKSASAAYWILMLLMLPAMLAGCFGPSGEPMAVLSSAVVTGSAPLEIGFDLSFSAHSGEQVMTFELDYGDGSAPTIGTDFDTIVHHVYESGGSYQATLQVTDEDGRSDTASLTITVNEVGPTIGTVVGNMAPDFTGHTTDGGQITLSDYQGQVILLDFWGAWCGPCRNSMPHLDDLVTKYASQGLVAITVATDLVKQDTINFLVSEGLTQFISVWEPGGKNGNFIDLLYHVTLYPTTFLLDRQGVIRWISIGYPGSLSDAMIESLL